MLGCFVGYECSDTGKCALIKKKTKILSGTKLQSLENMNSDIAIVDKKLILKVSSDDVTGLASTLPPEVNLFNRNYRPSPIISPDFLFKQCCTDRNIPESCQSKCTYVNYTKETIMQMYLGRDECPLQFARELHFCAAQGSDHTKCCKNRGVDSTLAKDKCLVFCDQRPGSVAILDNTHIHCYMQFENIKECFASRMRGMTLLSTLKIASFAGKESTKCLLKDLIKAKNVWINQPQRIDKIRNVFKLTGISLGTFAAFAKKTHCYSKKSSLRKEDTKEVVVSEYNATAADLWLILKPVIHWLLGATICVIFVAYFNIQIPMMLGKLVNIIAEYLGSKDTTHFQNIQPIGLKLFSFYVAQSIFTFAYIFFISMMGEQMATDMRLKLFSHLLHHDLGFYDAQRTSELGDRLNYDVQEFKSSFKLAVSQGLKTFAQTGGCIISMYMTSVKMTMITLGALPLIILVGTACSALLRTLSRAAQAQSAKASAIAGEAFSHIKTVKAFAMEDIEYEAYKEELMKAQLLNQTLGAGIGLFQGATNLFLNGIVLTVLYGGSKLILSNSLTPGDLMSFLVTSQTIQRSLSQFSVVSGSAVRGWSAYSRVFEHLHIEPKLLAGTTIIPHHALYGEIEFKDVHFSYETRENHKVLDGLNLKLAHGSITALCGPSGNGKSTIAGLIERFYDPVSGTVTLDGHDLKNLDPYWLRGKIIAYISQEPVLFHGTIEENIKFGKLDATDAEVQHAATLANAHQFIEEFPDGYKTKVGERGASLSSGQRARVCIARAIISDKPILILDEPTAALDEENQKMVTEAIENASKNRTVLVIAHRISTLKNASNIVVIKNKNVTEQGTHAQLMKAKGFYYNSVRSQDVS
uniref:ABC transmembrane type-1 domain-containing protein n=1 Tax=Rhabditophanes sp. KR3021 TaxID=114890 RepID=A0AC35U735_9BILA